MSGGREDIMRKTEEAPFRWDILAGLAIITVASVFVAAALPLEFGSLRHMGPGFLPISAAVILAALGVVVVIEGVTCRPSAPDLPKLRPFLVVVASPLVFAWMIGWAGMVPTVVVTSLLARMAEPLHWGWDLLLVPASLVAISVLVFIEFIGVAIPIF